VPPPVHAPERLPAWQTAGAGPVSAARPKPPASDPRGGEATTRGAGAQRGALARPSRPTGLERLWRVRTPREPRAGSAAEGHRAARALVRPPGRRDRQRLGQRRDRQVPGSPARVGLGALRHATPRAAEALDRAGQDSRPPGRARAVPGQRRGDRVVAGACGTQAPHLWRHVVRRGQVRQRSNRDRHLTGGGRPAAPDQAGMPLIAWGPLDDHLVHETAEHGVALGR